MGNWTLRITIAKRGRYASLYGTAHSVGRLLNCTRNGFLNSAFAYQVNSLLCCSTQTIEQSIGWANGVQTSEDCFFWRIHVSSGRDSSEAYFYSRHAPGSVGIQMYNHQCCPRPTALFGTAISCTRFWLFVTTLKSGIVNLSPIKYFLCEQQFPKLIMASSRFCKSLQNSRIFWRAQLLKGMTTRLFPFWY